MSRLRTVEVVVLAPLVAASLAGVALALGSRGADDEFLYRQRHPLRLRPAQVENIVITAPEPVAGRRTPGAAAHCRPLGRGELRNPWRCRVRYRSGRADRLAVTVRSDGSYLGRYSGGATARGCCIQLPEGK
jgi:hypothetical protein